MQPPSGEVEIFILVCSKYRRTKDGLGLEKKKGVTFTTKGNGINDDFLKVVKIYRTVFVRLKRYKSSNYGTVKKKTLSVSGALG